MSTTYPDLDFTSFPNSLDNIVLKTNITNATDANLVNQIQTAILSGDFVTAASVLNNNPQLNGKIFSANDYNQLRDCVLALERFYKNDLQTYVDGKQADWQAIIDKFNFKGTYSSTVQYYQNNLVEYTITSGTFLYLCVSQPLTGTPPTNTTYWRVLTLRGERGATGAGGMAFTYLWDSTMQYSLNDIVVYGDKWWAATQPNQGQAPVDGSAYWSVLITALPAIQIPVTATQPTNQILGDQWYQVIS